MAASGLDFLCPRSPVSWPGLLSQQRSARSCPARCQECALAQLVEAAERAASGASGQSDAHPLPSASPGEALGPTGFGQVLDPCPEQLQVPQRPQEKVKGGPWWGLGQCGTGAAATRRMQAVPPGSQPGPGG